MVRVIILYPNTPGGRFDHDYYAQKHIHLVAERLRPMGLLGIEAGRVVSTFDDKGTPPYVAMAHLVFETEDAFRTAFAAHLDEMAADVHNYTDISPEIIVTEMSE